MRSSLARRATSYLLAQSLLCSVVFSHSCPAKKAGHVRTQMATARPQPVQPYQQQFITSVVGPEPTIRVALVTMHVLLSSRRTSRLMNATGGSNYASGTGYLTSCEVGRIFVPCVANNAILSSKCWRCGLTGRS